MNLKIPALKTAADLKALLALLYNWVGLGFFLGTLTLMGPARWTVNHARANGWPYAAEKAAVLLLIAALAAVSLWAALRLKALAAPPRVRAGLRAAPAALFLLALWAWLTPALMIDRDAKTSAESFADLEFVFGPYPQEARLRALKEERYTAVISLLSPAVAPFEPLLLERERKAAAAAGVELVHIPMLPWVSENSHVEEELKKLAARGPGKYYVHCYLGKDRVNVFRRMLAGVSGGAVKAELKPETSRRLADAQKFERGPLTAIGEGVYLGPYPTDEEFFAFLLNGSVENIVSLLDPADPENARWIKKEADIAAKYGVPLARHHWASLDAAGRRKALSAIRALKRPVYIHAFLCRGTEYEEFLKAWRGR